MIKTDFMGYLKNYGPLGFVAAIVTGFILKFISQIASMIPGVTLDLQAIAVGATGLTEVIQTGLSTYARKLFGLIPITLGIPEFIYLGIGGMLFVTLGAWAVGSVKQLQFAKTKQGRLATILVVAGIVSGWLLAMSIGLPKLSAIIIMAVNALALSYILIWVDGQLNTNLTKAV